MKNEKSPLRNWLEENRWTTRAASREMGVHEQTIYMHLSGKSLLTMSSIEKYKAFGVPHSIILEHIRWTIESRV